MHRTAIFAAWTSRQRGTRESSPPASSSTGEVIDFGFRIDLLVDDALIVELKTVRALAPIHHAQLLSYLRLTGHRVGLLLNFHAERMKDGLKRVVNDREWQLPR